MTAETTCTICYEDFKPGDKVTQLKCNEAHLFHTDCIIEWISRGENTCPLCRAPIENVDDLRNMMEGGEYDRLLALDEAMERLEAMQDDREVSAPQQRTMAQRPERAADANS